MSTKATRSSARSSSPSPSTSLLNLYRHLVHLLLVATALLSIVPLSTSSTSAPTAEQVGILLALDRAPAPANSSHLLPLPQPHPHLLRLDPPACVATFSSSIRSPAWTRLGTADVSEDRAASSSSSSSSSRGGRCGQEILLAAHEHRKQQRQQQTPLTRTVHYLQIGAAATHSPASSASHTAVVPLVVSLELHFTRNASAYTLVATAANRERLVRKTPATAATCTLLISSSSGC